MTMLQFVKPGEKDAVLFEALRNALFVHGKGMPMEVIFAIVGQLCGALLSLQEGPTPITVNEAGVIIGVNLAHGFDATPKRL